MLSTASCDPMKRLLLAAAFVLVAPGALAQVDPKIAKPCMKATDFAGCVKAFTPQAKEKAQQNCKPQLRSGDSAQPITITFSNRSNQVVKTFWLDGNGQRVYYNTLKPGASYAQKTYASHPWLVTNENGSQILLTIIASETALSADIR